MIANWGKWLLDLATLVVCAGAFYGLAMRLAELLERIPDPWLGSGGKEGPPSPAELPSLEACDGAHFLVYQKGEQRFVFFYRDDQAGQVLARLEQYAADPACCLTACDVAVLRSQVLFPPAEPGNRLTVQHPPEAH